MATSSTWSEAAGMFHHNFLKLYVIVLAMLVAGCATDRSFGTAPDIVVTDLSQLPTPAQVRTVALAPFDSVEIAVLQDPSLNGTYAIDGEGNLAFPYLGTVAAEGLTSAQLATLLRRGLADGYINRPEVNVQSDIQQELNVSFGGEVNKPGNYTIAAASTLLRGVNAAGGTTEYAKSDDILIMREVDGQQYIGVFNLAAIRRGNYKDPPLIPGDIIYIGDLPAQRRLQSLLPYLSLVTTGAILLDRVSN